jgi:hypothetical protein
VLALERVGVNRIDLLQKYLAPLPNPPYESGKGAAASYTKSALIDPFSFLVVSSRRDVPPERLYKVRRVAEKGGIKPGFGMTSPLARGD